MLWAIQGRQFFRRGILFAIDVARASSLKQRERFFVTDALAKKITSKSRQDILHKKQNPTDAPLPNWVSLFKTFRG